MHGMTPALAISVATAAGGMRRLETLSLRLHDRQRGREGAGGRADSCERRGRGCAGQGAASVCDIGSEGAAALAKALPACARLATLDVRANSIGDEGNAALRAAASAAGPRLKLVRHW